MSSDQDQFSLRVAIPADRTILDLLIITSVTHLCSTEYTSSQIAAMTAQATGGRYDTLISNSTYYVVSAVGDPARIVASGGWSLPRIVSSDGGSATAQYESFASEKDLADIRGVYVHPDYARQGLGRRMVRECEAAASRAVNSTRYMLTSTMNAVPFYESCGYKFVEEHEIAVQDGEKIKVSMMEKKGATNVEVYG